ncbi:DUF6498-containing protein [bacterium]|nr:DUF6498-containing protein [bacterium]MDB4142675.1 DUF6498-containing protein [Akkermansiaceae bacterium]MDB4266253.1 DUF6498-containing protein [bacterium]MDB4284682.1 DUF6498-containing protein [bacterium]MDB4451577.1 DUF6498-containing protein [Akkermansiaceae bacterium]
MRMPLLSSALIALLIANLIPLWGVFFKGWSSQEVLVVYWLENVAVGLINIFKILTNRHEKTLRPAALFLAVFFTVHYGIFTFVHGAFVFSELNGFHGMIFPFDGMKQAFSDYRIVFLGFLGSHFFSFIFNYHGKGEAQRLELAKVMFLPYPRIFVLHLTIILGGMLVMALGSPAALVVLLVILKTIGDVMLHLREHRKGQKTPQ